MVEYLSALKSRFSGVKLSKVDINDSNELLLISELSVLDSSSTNVVDLKVSNLELSEKSSTKNPLLNLSEPSESFICSV